MNNYLISLHDSAKNVAGPKANMDNIKFLTELGFKNYWLKFETNTGLKSRMQKLWLAHHTIPRFFKVHSDIDNIILQYPLYSTYLMNNVVNNIRRYTNARLYFIIHDVESIRLFINKPEYYRDELAFLNRADGIVGHNQKMNAWLSSHGVTTKLVNLEIFDYANPSPLPTKRPYRGTICYAGNLKKAKFLQKVDLKHQLMIFGPNPATNYPNNVIYQGQYLPDELPGHLTENFGLVWDGTTIDGCNGVFGEYMKYNDPHKTSLYLSSGLPVIIWKKAALANFVEKNNVGLTINSLNELDDLLDSLSEDQYEKMRQNVNKIAQRMRSGFYVKKAVKQLIDVGD
jgi:hypothetical protein